MNKSERIRLLSELKQTLLYILHYCELSPCQYYVYDLYDEFKCISYICNMLQDDEINSEIGYADNSDDELINGIRDNKEVDIIRDVIHRNVKIIESRLENE